MTAPTRSLDSTVSLVRARVLLHQSEFANEWRLILVDAKFFLQSVQSQSRYTTTQTASNLSGVPKVKEMKQDRQGSLALDGQRKGHRDSVWNEEQCVSERRRKQKPRKEPTDAQAYEPQPLKKAATVRSETEIGQEGKSRFASVGSDQGGV